MDVTTDVWHFCVQCSYRAEWKFQVDRHFARNHMHFDHSSDFFDVKLKLDEHKRYHFTPFCKLAPYELGQAPAYTDRYKCEHCSFSTNSTLMLTKHVNTCRAVEQVPDRTELVVVPSSDCSYGNNQLKQADSYSRAHCSYETNLFGAFRKHNWSHLRHEATEWFNCEHCPYVARQKRYLKRHIEAKHALKRAEPATAFECKQCSYKSKYKRDLNRHSLQHYSHDAINWFECLQCSYKAKAKDVLKTHVMLRHAPKEAIKWHECMQCSFKTKTARNLRWHALRHAPDEAIAWHECAECSYKAKRKAMLKRHLRIYHDDSNETNTNRFGCSQCSYRADCRAQLKRHESVRHSDIKQIMIDEVKWYECGQCSYRSKARSNIKRHKLLVHKIVE